MAERTDWMGYITYVFEDFEPLKPDARYVMCVRFPGWDEKSLKIRDRGFVTVRYVTSGTDSWFDGKSNVPYKKTDIHFLKFVPEPEQSGEVEVMLD